MCFRYFESNTNSKHISRKQQKIWRGKSQTLRVAADGYNIEVWTNSRSTSTNHTISYKYYGIRSLTFIHFTIYIYIQGQANWMPITDYLIYNCNCNTKPGYNWTVLHWHKPAAAVTVTRAENPWIYILIHKYIDDPYTY